MALIDFNLSADLRMATDNVLSARILRSGRVTAYGQVTPKRQKVVVFRMSTIRQRRSSRRNSVTFPQEQDMNLPNFDCCLSIPLRRRTIRTNRYSRMRFPERG